VGVVDVIRAAITTVALLVLGACSAPQTTPEEVVAHYFASLGRDPIRSLAITTDAFHRAHGLGIVTTSEARAWRAGAKVKPATADRIDHYQTAWLALQNRDQFTRAARGLVATPNGTEIGGALATVVVTVTPPQGTPFVQTFRLKREDEAWRVDGVEQSGVTRDNQISAFVAHPTEAARRALEASFQKR